MWWKREFGQMLTGNSFVWWVNIASAKSHLWHHLTSPLPRFLSLPFCVNSKQRHFAYILRHKHKFIKQIKWYHWNCICTMKKKTKTETHWGWFAEWRIMEDREILLQVFTLSQRSFVESVNLLLILWWRVCLGLLWFKMPTGALHFPHSLSPPFLIFFALFSPVPFFQRMSD